MGEWEASEEWQTPGDPGCAPDTALVIYRPRKRASASEGSRTLLLQRLGSRLHHLPAE